MAKFFIGRESEEAEFKRLSNKSTASLIVCQGRRRIGKSTFFRHCAKGADLFLSFEGLAPRDKINKKAQLEAFATALNLQTKAPKLTLDSWPQAFDLLDSVLPTTGTIVILFDEISWMAIGDPDFPGYVKAAWDARFSQHPNLILVLCGSVSSWIEKNILKNTGFAGRPTWHLKLPPLALPACNQFWTGKAVSAAEKLKLLAVTGGVPRYLEELDPAQSAEQNVERLCFNSSGLLFNEFNLIFHDIFTKRADTCRDIMAVLTDGAKTLAEISSALGKNNSGGSLSAILEDLESAGFLHKDASFSPDTAKTMPRKVRYRIFDNYIRFYLKFIEPAAEQIKKGIYQMSPIETLQAWDTIMGLQFENLILSNLRLLIERINLGNVPVLNAGPYYQPATSKAPGSQIDLMLRTKSAVYVFEIKFRKSVGFSVMDEVREKVKRLNVDSSLSVRTGLIYQGELDPKIPEADYFDHIVRFEDLLK